MTTKKTTLTKRKTHTASRPPATAFDHLHALVHTLRCIAQYEDVLCELSHEVRRTGRLSPETSQELSAILDKMPSDGYLLDLEAVRTALVMPRVATKIGAKKTGKGVSRRKNSTGVAKKVRKTSLK